MQNPYQRQLIGQQTGVQLNFPVDKTDRMLPGLGDSILGTVGKFNRGRIDRPFFVPSDKLRRYLGTPQTVRLARSNEIYVQVYRAFATGAAGAVISRLHSDEAVNKWVVIGHGNGPEAVTLVEKVSTAKDFICAFRMEDCIDEGVFIEVARSREYEDYLNIRITERNKDSEGKDTNEGDLLYEFEGSCLIDAKNEDGNTAYIGDVANTRYGDNLKFEAQFDTEVATLKPDDYTSVVKTTVEAYSDKGAFVAKNYTDAVKSLGETALQYKIILVNSPSVDLVQAMIELAPKINRKAKIDVPAGLPSAEAVINWVKQFNYKGDQGMFIEFLWSPVSLDDPLGVSGNMEFGSSGTNVGYWIARNAVTNSFGLPKLNQPIGGKDFMLTGSRMNQLISLSDTDKASLAAARVNPVQLVEYHDGSGFVWIDAQTGAKKNGITKLASASDIVIWITDIVGRYGKSLEIKPMTEAIELMSRYLKKYLPNCETSKWLTPSVSLGGRSFQFSVAPNEQYPDDRMDVTMDLAVDGVVRQIHISTNVYSRD